MISTNPFDRSQPSAFSQSAEPSANERPQALGGWVNAFYRHYKGKRLGPYFVRRWKVGGKVYREYVKAEDVERVKAECEAHRQIQSRKREGAQRCNTFMDNWIFLGNMCERYDKRKLVTPAMEAYAWRLHNEGMHITGRPQMRRKTKRTLVTVDGQKMIKNEVFELDGTTKVFMVPFVIKNPFERFQGSFAALKTNLLQCLEKVQAFLDTQNPPPITDH